VILTKIKNSNPSGGSTQVATERRNDRIVPINYELEVFASIILYDNHFQKIASV
jgi:hypothetical protein